MTVSAASIASGAWRPTPSKQRRRPPGQCRISGHCRSYRGRDGIGPFQWDGAPSRVVHPIGYNPKSMLRYFTAGESHGEALVAFLSGMPAGLKVDQAFLDRELWRRQQGYGRGGRMKIE